MEDDLRQAFATLSAQIADVGTDARQASALAREAAHGTAMLRIEQEALKGDVGQLKAAVFGSKPPPPMAPPVVTLPARITHSEGELAEIAGRVLAVQSMNEDQSRELAKLKAGLEQAAQDRADIAKAIAEIQSAVVGVVKNPKVVFVGKVLFGLACTYAAGKGIHLLP